MNYWLIWDTIVVRPELTVVSPNITFVRPNFTEVTLDITVGSPYITVISPNITNVTPDITEGNHILQLVAQTHHHKKWDIIENGYFRGVPKPKSLTSGWLGVREGAMLWFKEWLEVTKDSEVVGVSLGNSTEDSTLPLSDMTRAPTIRNPSVSCTVCKMKSERVWGG